MKSPISVRWLFFAVIFAVGANCASSATIFTERWSTPGDSRGWFIGALGGSGMPSYVGGQVNWSVNASASSDFLTGF
jgi:methionine synthase I (cobalamin-dependent)